MGQSVSYSPFRYMLWALLALVGTALTMALSTAKFLDWHVRSAKTAPAQNLAAQPNRISLSANSAAENDDVSEKASGLQRVEPRAPLSDIAAPPLPLPPKPAKDLPKRWRTVGNGFASAAGIIQAGSVSITLAGLDTLTETDTCTAPSGQIWPCGMVARTAFRAYLRSRTLNCDMPDGLIDTATSAECLLAGGDPAKWLVENGWARARADGPYVSEADNAKASGAGIYGPPPH